MPTCFESSSGSTGETMSGWPLRATLMAMPTSVPALGPAANASRASAVAAASRIATATGAMREPSADRRETAHPSPTRRETFSTTVCKSVR
jgi:hypothetical protein